MRRVLVLGGSGALGNALVRELGRTKVEGAFTWHQNQALAVSLATETGFTSHLVDLRDPDAVPHLFQALEKVGWLPDAVVHAAGAAPPGSLEDITPEAFLELQVIHGGAALACAQEMARRNLRGSLVLVAALDGLAPVPAPAHYAASQGALWGLTQALGKELGPRGILVNLAVIGVLDGGISEALKPELRQSYVKHAALGRTGTCIEAAKALRWLALENTYLNGAQFPITGGLGW